MKLSPRQKDALRPLRDSLYLIGCTIYDALRFLRYSGIWFKENTLKRDYKAVKIYHRMEKSLSFRNRKATSGWAAAADFVHLMERRHPPNASLQFHERVGIKVLSDFVSNNAAPSNEYAHVLDFLDRHRNLADGSTEGGTRMLSAAELQTGVLHSPEQFFMSRHSVRDFKDVRIDKALLHRALSLATKTPSVCNRQSWFVYHLDERTRIDGALALQNGNKGFGHQIPCLLIITADLRAFDTAHERYQHWIDGGMFSMSLVLALHSLGLASCCLNWDQGPMNDLRLRSFLQLNDHHTVLMMLAVGHPNDDIKVCASARRSATDFYKKIGNEC